MFLTSSSLSGKFSGEGEQMKRIKARDLKPGMNLGKLGLWETTIIAKVEPDGPRQTRITMENGMTQRIGNKVEFEVKEDG
jgi:hypothetical protein